MYNYICKLNADLAHPVERHLAKVKVASSSLVIRSKKQAPVRVLNFLVQRIENRTGQFRRNRNSPVDCFGARVRAGRSFSSDGRELSGLNRHR